LSRTGLDIVSGGRVTHYLAEGERRQRMYENDKSYGGDHDMVLWNLKASGLKLDVG